MFVVCWFGLIGVVVCLCFVGVLMIWFVGWLFCYVLWFGLCFGLVVLCDLCVLAG